MNSRVVAPGKTRTCPHCKTIILESDAPISLEYDGELGETPSPARFGLGTSAVDFVATA